MQILDRETIAKARKLRATGMKYADIATEIGTDASLEALRYHCADVPVDGVLKTRAAKASVRKDGAAIRPFTDDEDAAIVAAVAAGAEKERGGVARIAAQLDRKHHSVAARIKNLRRHGKITS